MSWTKSQNFWQKGIVFKILGFLLIWASFKCYFWIPHLKIMRGTHFHENITSQTHVNNINASLWYSKTASFRKNGGILAKIYSIHISVTIQVARLKFGSFLYLYSKNLYTKFHGFLKTWVPGPYYSCLFDVEFPKCGFGSLFQSS